MTTEAERIKLYQFSKNINLAENDCLLEFGVYFGGNLEALAKGLTSNSSFNKTNQLIGVDLFKTAKNGEFSKLVREDAKKYQVESELKIVDDSLDWFDVVKKRIIKYDNTTLIQTKASEYRHTFGNIALIHFDLPKFFNEMKELFYECLDSIKKDCIFIFQDFFYHWSAETIAFIYFLIKNKKIKFVYGVSSSLICQNIKLEKEDLKNFEIMLSNPKEIVKLLEECYEFLREYNFCGARIIYAEEYYMAVIQYTYENGFETIKKKYETILLSIMTKYGRRVYEELKSYNYNGKDIYRNDLDV